MSKQRLPNYKRVTGVEGDLLRALYTKNPGQLANSISRGADPDCKTAFQEKDIMYPPLLEIIIHHALSFPNKLDYIRPLVQGGPNGAADLSFLRKCCTTMPLDNAVLRLGFLSYEEGDKECAGFLLAHLIALDIAEGQNYDFNALINAVLAGIGGVSKNTAGDEVRAEAAAIITQNQHELVEYVNSSNDPVAVFLKSQKAHPSSSAWMTKMGSVNPDDYSRPSPEFMNYVERVVDSAGDFTSSFCESGGKVNPESRFLFQAFKADLRSSPLVTHWKPSMHGTPDTPPADPGQAMEMARDLLGRIANGPKQP